MGKVKEQMIELMDSGASNLYTVVVEFFHLGERVDYDEYEHTNFKTAMLQAEGCRALYQSVDAEVHLKALHLRTMRERLIPRYWKNRKKWREMRK